MCELYLSEDNCTGNISVNTRLHQLHLGEQKMGTAIVMYHMLVTTNLTL